MSDQTPEIYCLGRAGMDLYALEDGADFHAVSGFEKQVGGSPANIAIGLARLGVKAGIITRVSDDLVGHYVAAELERNGVDIGALSFDASGTRTSLAVTEVKDEECGVVIYRHRAADLALSPGDVDTADIAGAKLLLITGTALSAEPSRSAARHALDTAIATGTRCVLDLDYRACAWASRNEAEEVCREFALTCHVVVGNDEELALIAEDTATAVELLFDAGVDIVVAKQGREGSAIYQRHGATLRRSAKLVREKKPFGAGDAFAARLCAGWLKDEPLERVLEEAAAAAAWVVGSRRCGIDTPTRDEIARLIAESESSGTDGTGVDIDELRRTNGENRT